MSIRKAIIAEIELLSMPSKQLEYENNVPFANVPAELICGFCDDLYHPKSEQMLSRFNADELKELAHLFGVLPPKADINSVRSYLAPMPRQSTHDDQIIVGMSGFLY